MEAFVLKRSSRVMPGKLTEKSKSISNKDIFFCLKIKIMSQKLKQHSDMIDVHKRQGQSQQCFKHRVVFIGVSKSNCFCINYMYAQTS